jgi:opacity protein-like surface antigen
MKSNRARLFGCCTVLLLLLFSNPAGAERFADLMAGISFTEDKTVTFTSGSQQASADPQFDNSYAVGYRMGYWSEHEPYLGVAFGIDYTSIEENGDLDISVLSLSPLVMIRVPLFPSPKYPKGEWLPFVAAGPGLFISNIEYEVANSPVPGMVGIPGLSGGFEDEQFDIGLDLRAGIKKMVAPAWAVNLEYRFIWFEPSYEDYIMGETIQTQIEVYNHSLMLGVSYNF